MNAPFGISDTGCLVPIAAAKARMRAWRRILEAVAEQREALEHRLWREDPDDLALHDDARIWGDLTSAVADFLKARRAAG